MPTFEFGERAQYCTYCPECGAQFYEGEEGFDAEECFECGGTECYEIPA